MEQEQAIGAKRVWESVKLYTVKCAKCSKWRLIPTKEKYEEIRERIVERSFLCDTARAWRPNVSCNEESDVKQDDSFLWPMDKPRIPQTPPGWQRILRIRAEGGTKFADVYVAYNFLLFLFRENGSKDLE
ncbi:methyl-CpG-binding domain-containing protein 2-like [Sesamum indicum]|uniref:Methyl-CpG-binding domain-containing protein 2-like n=1 Tax=Sesamum indicum TaxID=4182 RepID=A0A8M8V0A3_SESIN|nr:methyl-CpG-binding domain-containing protein 2-like [Sesamum indicum]